MDHFTVPQFIEHKAKIIGPLTLQQFIYIGTAAGICFIFYFTAPLFLFIVVTILSMTVAATLAFGKSGGRPITVVIKNFIAFRMSPKIYLWKKKTGPPLKLIQAKKPEIQEIRKTPVPTIIGKSHLKDLAGQVEIGKK